MRIVKRSTAAALALAVSAGQALAAPCAEQRDMQALKTASLQQRLMVAALTCRDVPSYNRFVVTYQKELQASDARLLKFFKKTGAGERGYHSYKTHLANGSSMTSLKDNHFCADADASFQAALSKATLADVLAGEPGIDTGYDACFSREANAAP
jgi:hypothetical protein